MLHRRYVFISFLLLATARQTARKAIHVVEAIEDQREYQWKQRGPT